LSWLYKVHHPTIVYSSRTSCSADKGKLCQPQYWMDATQVPVLYLQHRMRYSSSQIMS
jgi:hypothetical protein